MFWHGTESREYPTPSQRRPPLGSTKFKANIMRSTRPGLTWVWRGIGEMSLGDFIAHLSTHPAERREILPPPTPRIFSTAQRTAADIRNFWALIWRLSSYFQNILWHFFFVKMEVKCRTTTTFWVKRQRFMECWMYSFKIKHTKYALDAKSGRQQNV